MPSSSSGFRCRVLRLTWEAHSTVRFPAWAAIAWRGALGFALQEHFPAEYARLFAPSQIAGPSGLRQPPRPFVLRAHTSNGRQYAAGEQFSLDVHLFDCGEGTRDTLLAALQQAGTAIGVGRGRLALASMTDEIACVPLVADVEVRQLQLRFVTPTDWKGAGETPEFGPLFARACERVMTLAKLYDGNVLERPVVGPVELLGQQLQWQETPRRSARTGQQHELRGWVGTAEYAGDLSAALPWLRAAELGGIGRHTAWGCGVAEFDTPPRQRCQTPRA